MISLSGKQKEDGILTDKKTTNKYSREIIFPAKVAKRYCDYCAATKMKFSEPLRVMVMESLPQLHNAENLGQIVEKTKNWNTYGSEFVKFHVRLPDAVTHEIRTYCKLFHLKRCHFLYYLVEEKLLQRMSEVFKNEDE